MESEREKFNALPFDHKCKFVLDYGRYLEMFIVGKDYSYTLYMMDKDLVVLWYNRKRKQVIDIYIPSYEQLSVYIKGININDLHYGKYKH